MPSVIESPINTALSKYSLVTRSSSGTRVMELRSMAELWLSDSEAEASEASGCEEASEDCASEELSGAEGLETSEFALSSLRCHIVASTNESSRMNRNETRYIIPKPEFFFFFEYMLLDIGKTSALKQIR